MLFSGEIKVIAQKEDRKKFKGIWRTWSKDKEKLVKMVTGKCWRHNREVWRIIKKTKVGRVRLTCVKDEVDNHNKNNNVCMWKKKSNDGKYKDEYKQHSMKKIADIASAERQKSSKNTIRDKVIINITIIREILLRLQSTNVYFHFHF